MQVARQVAWTEAEVEDRPGQVPEVLIDRSQVVRVLMLPGAEETDVQVRRTRSTPAEHRPQSPSRSQAPGRGGWGRGTVGGRCYVRFMTAQVVDWSRREEPTGLAAVLWQDAIDDRPGLPARLASMAAELRLIAGNYPVTGLGAAGLGDAIEQAQVIREMAHALTAVLAGEVEQRGLPDEQGLSRNDWVTGHSPNLEGGQSAAVTAVGAALGQERWQDPSPQGPRGGGDGGPGRGDRPVLQRGAQGR